MATSIIEKAAAVYVEYMNREKKKEKNDPKSPQAVYTIQLKLLAKKCFGWQYDISHTKGYYNDYGQLYFMLEGLYIFHDKVWDGEQWRRCFYAATEPLLRRDPSNAFTNQLEFGKVCMKLFAELSVVYITKKKD